MASKKELIEEFTKAHEEYIRALCEYVPPPERKLLMEESITKSTGILEKTDSLSEDDLLGFIGSVKAAHNTIVAPKGMCSREALMNFLRVQDLVMAVAMGLKSKGEEKEAIVIGILELTNSLVADTLQNMTKMGMSSTKSTWETNRDIHKMVMEATQTLTAISDSVKDGRVMAMKLPVVDKEKYNGLMN